MTRPFAALSSMSFQTKPVNHIDALKNLMDRRAYAVLTEEQRARLDLVIETYQRLYVHG